MMSALNIASLLPSHSTDGQPQATGIDMLDKDLDSWWKQPHVWSRICAFHLWYINIYIYIHLYHWMPRSRQEWLWNLLLTSAFFEIFEQPVIPAAFISLDLFEDLWPLTKISSPRSILGTLGIDSPAISWLYSKAIILIPYLAMVDVDVFPRHIETWQKSETKMGDSMEFQASKMAGLWGTFSREHLQRWWKKHLDWYTTLSPCMEEWCIFHHFSACKAPKYHTYVQSILKAYSMIHTSPCTNRSNKLKHFP